MTKNEENNLIEIMQLYWSINENSLSVDYDEQTAFITSVIVSDEMYCQIKLPISFRAIFRL